MSESAIPTVKLKVALAHEGPVYTVYKNTVHAHPATIGHTNLEEARFLQAPWDDVRGLGFRECRRCFGE